MIAMTRRADGSLKKEKKRDKYCERVIAEICLFMIRLAFVAPVTSNAEE